MFTAGACSIFSPREGSPFQKGHSQFNTTVLVHGVLMETLRPDKAGFNRGASPASFNHVKPQGLYDYTDRLSTACCIRQACADQPEVAFYGITRRASSTSCRRRVVMPPQPQGPRRSSVGQAGFNNLNPSPASLPKRSSCQSWVGRSAPAGAEVVRDRAERGAGPQRYIAERRKV